MILGPTPLDILPSSPSSSESCLVWQLFNLCVKKHLLLDPLSRSTVGPWETFAHLPSKESWHRARLTGGGTRLCDPKLNSRLRFPGSKVRCRQQPIRAHLVFATSDNIVILNWTWSFWSLCDKLILRQLWKILPWRLSRSLKVLLFWLRRCFAKTSFKLNMAQDKQL